MGRARVPTKIFLNIVPTALVTRPPGLVWAGLTCSRDGCLLGATSWMARPAVRLLSQLLTSFWVVLIFSTSLLHSVSYVIYIKRCIVNNIICNFVYAAVS